MVARMGGIIEEWIKYLAELDNIIVNGRENRIKTGRRAFALSSNQYGHHIGVKQG